MAKDDRLLIVLFFLAAFPLFLGLDSVGLFEREETRYAEIAREMLQSNEWIVPTLAGFPYLEKPPLTVWLTAGSFYIFGVGEWGARLVSLFAALLLLFFTYRIGKRLGGFRLGLTAGALLATSPLFFGMARILSTDTLFAGFTIGAVDFFLLARERNSPGIRLGLGVFVALAFLCKGPLALVLLALCGGSFAFSERSWQRLRIFFDPIVLLAFLFLVLPWFVWISIRYPSFVDFYLVRQHLERFLPLHLEDKDLHAGPFWYFIPILCGGFFPWIFILPFTIWKSWKQPSSSSNAIILKSLGIWTLAVFVFFSLSAGKRVPYILPIWPALSILVAARWVLRAEKGKAIARVWLASIMLLPAATLAHAVLAEKGLADLYVMLWVFLSLLAVGILITSLFFWKGMFRGALISAVLSMTTLNTALALAAIPRVSSVLSLNTIARQVVGKVRQNALIVSYPYYFPGLSFYGLPNVHILGSPHELEFGLSIEDNSTSPMLSQEDLQCALETPRQVVLMGVKSRLFRILNTLDPHSRLQTIAEGGNWIFLSNQ